MNTQSKIVTIAGIAGIALVAGTASAQVTITQSNGAAPTYTNVLDFEDATPLAQYGWTDGTQWSGIGLDLIAAGASNGPGADLRVGDFDAENGGWGLGSGLSANGGFGLFLNFGQDLTEFSAQAWDNSGAPTFFGGGMGVYAFNDGVQVANIFVTPAFGGIGDSWFDITTANGHKFDEVRFAGFGMVPETWMDNASWNMVPTPASAALLGLGGLVATRRRR